MVRPELDAHKEENKALLEEVMVRYEIASTGRGIAIFHPVTTEQDSIAQQAKTLFDALDKTGKYYVVIMPNNDPGVKAIKKELDRLDKSRFRILPSMRFKYFSCLLQNANILIGNSSTGVREAPFLGVPSVDIGTRQ